jgi:hypothetical protein
MPGPTQPWDQSGDPRENTVDLPRIDLAGLADYFRGVAPPPRPSLPAQAPQEPESPASPADADLPADGSAVPAASSDVAPTTAVSPVTAGSASPPLPVQAAQATVASGPAVFTPRVRPPAGSVADLRSRLARLPAGHPSSPYDDGGQARPLPTRLRQLELGLPAPGREPGDGATSRAGVRGRYAGIRADVASDLEQSTGLERSEPQAESVNADLLPAADPTNDYAMAQADLLPGRDLLPEADLLPGRDLLPEADLLPGGDLPPHPDLLPGSELLPGPDLPPHPDVLPRPRGEPGRRYGVDAGFQLRKPVEPARGPEDGDRRRPLPGRNVNGRQAERPRGPQWQDPYAADPDGNGNGWRESEADTPSGPVFGPWRGGGTDHARGARNGGRNGSGSGQAEFGRPEPGRPDFGPLDREWQDPERRDPERRDRSRPDFGPPPRSRPEREGPDRRPPDRRAPDARPPDTRPLNSDLLDRRLPGARQQDRVQPDRVQQDTLQHGTLQPHARRADTHRADADRPDADRPDADRPDAEMSRSETSRPDSDAGPDGDGLRELVERTLTTCRAAEGRNMFGTYGSSGLTPAMQRLAAQLPAGGLAPGSEADSLKPADRFAAKLSRLIARNPARSPADLADTISDAVRYAFAFETADYTEATWLVHRKLKAQGFELEARRNRWESPEYKGIFTRWRDPAHGIAFEVQFHTIESWAVAKSTHDAYLRITDPTTPPAERAQLRARQLAATAGAKAPPGCMEIADFRAEPR